ncbi:hypothetical protein D9M68_590740 [compost metagenome]
MMIAVITGDVVNSRKLSEDWIGTLKGALSDLKCKKKKWEIYRGDSFQLELNIEDALLSAIYIKACLKTLKKGDIRVGIGIGHKNRVSHKVTEANGEAFINSGMVFDDLEMNKVSMALKTPWVDFDEEFNFYLKLALLTMDSWGQVASEMVKYAIQNRNVKQDKIASLSGKSQSSVSEALKRAHYAEIMELESKYRTRIINLTKKA